VRKKKIKRKNAQHNEEMKTSLGESITLQPQSPWANQKSVEREVMVVIKDRLERLTDNKSNQRYFCSASLVGRSLNDVTMR